MMSMSSEAVVTFADGLPGFETCRRFILVKSGAIDPFTVVQGLDGAAPPSFVAIEPHRIEQGYRSTLDRSDLDRLQAADGHPLLWLALVAAQPDGSATVNLRAPLVINPSSMRGIQLLPVESDYSVSVPLPVAS